MGDAPLSAPGGPQQFFSFEGFHKKDFVLGMICIGADPDEFVEATHLRSVLGRECLVLHHIEAVADEIHRNNQREDT